MLDGWLFTLESDAVAAEPALADGTDAMRRLGGRRLLEQRLAAVVAKTPAFAQALRGIPCRHAGR